MKKKLALVILDGWGYGKKDESDAISKAKTPFFDSLKQTYSDAILLTDGENVGLPKGQMGNSEVGHLNIGAGRIVYQDLVKINRAIEDQSFFNNKELVAALDYAEKNNKSIHLLGLVSDGGIHSHQNHLLALCKAIKKRAKVKAYIHAFTDGRDTDPKSGIGFIDELISEIEHTNCQVASISGRYYAMDRDLRWERVKLTYDAIKHGKGELSEDLLRSVRLSYEQGVTDEFIKPIVHVNESGQAIGRLEKGDVVICFNFRTDRCREITRALSQEDFPEFNMKKENYFYVTMTNYDNTFKNVRVMFQKDNLNNTLGEVVSQNQLKQIRIAETEKYPHVTFFFSGGREEPFRGESRLMVPSPKVATYDLQPEMSAKEVKEKIIKEIQNQSAEFICLNFANPDMVGHTGVFDAIVKAVETVDQQLKDIVLEGLKQDYAFLIIADHGNADFVINKDGSPNTAHTTNPVPVILVEKEPVHQINNGILADVAPTILELLNLDVPKEMTGKSLLN